MKFPSATQVAFISTCLLGLSQIPLSESFSPSRINKFNQIQSKTYPSWITTYTQMESKQFMSAVMEDTKSDITVKASQIRSAQLTNADGENITLGDKMGKGTSLVIFLRHMG